jgi:hypothetical protein
MPLFRSGLSSLELSLLRTLVGSSEEAPPVREPPKTEPPKGPSEPTPGKPGEGRGTTKRTALRKARKRVDDTFGGNPEDHERAITRLKFLHERFGMAPPEFDSEGRLIRPSSEESLGEPSEGGVEELS